MWRLAHDGGHITRSDQRRYRSVAENLMSKSLEARAEANLLSPRIKKDCLSVCI